MQFWKKKVIENTEKGIATEIQSATQALTEIAVESISKQVLERLKTWYQTTEGLEELKAKNRNLKEENDQLALKKKLEEQEIRHLVRLKQESLEIEFQKKELELKNQLKDAEMELQKKFFDDTMKQLESTRQEIRSIYEKIMERLPNVNMTIRQRTERNEQG